MLKRKIYNEMMDNGSNLRVVLLEIRDQFCMVEEEFGTNLHSTSFASLEETDEYERLTPPKRTKRTNKYSYTKTPNIPPEEESYFDLYD